MFNQPMYGQGAAPSQMQRLNLMQQQMPQYQPPFNPMPQPSPSFLNGRAVTSLEEARAVVPPFDGSSVYMPSANENKIYIKYLDLNGLPVFQTYVLEQAQEQPVYAERAVVAELAARVAKLEERLKGAEQNVQSNAVNANDVNLASQQ